MQDDTHSLNSANSALKTKMRFNLSPDHQHVRATFKDTSKAVYKLRREAEERRQEMRNEKNLKESQRLTQWGTDLNSKKNKKATAKKFDEFDEMHP